MRITIPHDAEELAKVQAAAAGFTNVDDYVANLIRLQQPYRVSKTRTQALADLRRLRQNLPKLSTDGIVQAVQEARSDLQ